MTTPERAEGGEATPRPTDPSTAADPKRTPRVPDVGANVWDQLSLEAIAAEIGMAHVLDVPGGGVR